MKKIGILGGTFNPIHAAHIMLARQAYEQLGLDHVLVMPLKKPQLKDASVLVSDEDRTNMIKLAISGIDYLQFSDFELRRDGNTFTSDTVKMLHSMYPDTRFYFIIGGDSLDYFDKWHEPETILANCALCSTGRADYDNKKAAAAIKSLVQKFNNYEACREIPEIVNLKMPLMNISSSEIRNRISCSMSIAGMMDDKVINYINGHGLYRSKSIEDIRCRLSEILSEKRFRHTIGVAETAAFIAMSNDFDPVKAYTAGILHDCAKNLSDEELLAEAEKYDYIPSDFEKIYVNNLLHSKIGAYHARYKFGIEDDDIFNSIFYHTTGRRNMSLLEKIIFISDTVEPGRTMNYSPSLDIIRNTATSDVDMACQMILDNNIPYLISMFGQNISPDSLETYRYFCELNGCRREPFE